MTEQQFREVSLMVTLTKLLIAAAFVLGGWQAYVTLTLNQHTEQIVEVKASVVASNFEAAARMQDYRNWREDVTKIITRQTTLIESQQAQVAHLTEKRTQ